MLFLLMRNVRACTAVSWVGAQQQKVLCRASQAASRREISIPKHVKRLIMHSNGLPPRADAVLSYWLGPDFAQPQPVGYWPPAEQTKLWFKGGPEVDEYIKHDFTEDVNTLAAGGYDDWLSQPQAAVAGIVLADQFTRNIFRGSAEAFSLDDKARQWSHHLRSTFDLKTQLPSAAQRYFSYMPLMHSELLQDQELLLQLVQEELDAVNSVHPGSAAAKNWSDVKRFAEAHSNVVAQWGGSLTEMHCWGAAAHLKRRQACRMGAFPDGKCASTQVMNCDVS